MTDFQASFKKLYSLELFGIKLGLQNLSRLLQLLDNPQNGQKFIHIAGTNGKGSVCAILSKALEGAGFNVGLFTSPHLVTIRERFRYNNSGISENELASVIEEIWPLIEELYKKDTKITFFEATVAIALLYYKRKKCDFIVWETGMGGRLDGTNIVNPIITAITTISYDHQQYLGDTLEKIAFEKAGIIKRKVPIFLGDIKGNALEVITQRAKESNSKLYLFENSSIHKLSLPGEYQKHNISLAFSILQYLSCVYGFDLISASNAIGSLKWHARCQILPDGKILDGAHNQEGIDALISSIQSTFPNQKFTVIFGCLEERNPKNAILALSQIADRFIFTPIVTSRKSYQPDKFIQLMSAEESFSIACITVDSAKEALRVAGKSKTLITGSLYLAGEILREYYSEDEITKI